MQGLGTEARGLADDIRRPQAIGGPRHRDPLASSLDAARLAPGLATNRTSRVELLARGAVVRCTHRKRLYCISSLDLRFEPTTQAADSPESIIHQELRKLRRRDFVRARPIRDDVTLARQTEKSSFAAHCGSR